MDYSTIFGGGFVTKYENSTTSIVYYHLVNMKNYHSIYGENIEQLMQSLIDNHVTQLYIHDMNYMSYYFIDWLTRNNIPVNTKGTKQTDAMSYQIFRDADGNTYYIKIYMYIPGNRRAIEIKSSHNKTMKPLSKLYSDYKLFIDTDIDIKKLSDQTIQLNDGDELKYSDMESAWVTAHITANIMKILKKAGYSKLTISSDAMSHWLKIEESNKRYHRDDMPDLDPTVEANLRFAYRGGFNWLNDKYKNLTVGCGLVYDVNSLYPYCMRNFDLPYGAPEIYYGVEPTDKLFVAHIIIGYATLKKGGIKCISNMQRTNKPVDKSTDKPRKKSQNKSAGSTMTNEYLPELEQFECWLTNYDLELLRSNYEVFSMKIYEVYAFNKTRGWFDAYIDKYYEIKKNASGSKRELAKLMLDSLYGRFGIKTNKKKSSASLVDGILQFDNKTNVDNKSVRYLPIALFVTSIGRKLLIDTASEIGVDKILYMDTDSIHILGSYFDDELLKISKELGDWKIEHVFKKAKYINLKTYIMDIVDNDKISTLVKMAGAPDAVRDRINWYNFVYGASVDGKTYTEIVPGGCIRKHCKYTISAR